MLPVFLDVCIDAKKIINRNIYNMVELLQLTAEGLSYDEVLAGIYPQYILLKDINLCINSINTLAAMCMDDYQREYISPFYEFTLYHIILWWIDVTDVQLDEIPLEYCLFQNESNLYNKINDVNYYLEFMFEDWDFLNVNDLYELYRLNPIFVEEYMNINIKEYLVLMPADIEKDCEKLILNNVRKNKEIIEYEDFIIKNIYSFLQMSSLRVQQYKECKEDQFSDTVRDGLFLLFNNNNLLIEREQIGGHSVKKSGELDFFIYNLEDGIYNIICIGENKKWGNYLDSLGQLVGYMNIYTHFGFTIIYNQSTKLETVLKRRKEILAQFNIDGNFKVIGEIEELDKYGLKNVLRTKHENPEQIDSYFTLYHFVFNVYEPERQRAAEVGRKRAKVK